MLAPECLRSSRDFYAMLRGNSQGGNVLRFIFAMARCMSLSARTDFGYVREQEKLRENALMISASLFAADSIAVIPYLPGKALGSKDRVLRG
jgi:hypothetical protein